jgi:hypothetical protein
MQNTQRGWEPVYKSQITAETCMLDQHTYGPTPAPHLVVDVGKGIGVLWSNRMNRQLWRQGRAIGAREAIQELMEGALIEAMMDERRENIWFNPIGRNAIRIEIEDWRRAVLVIKLDNGGDIVTIFDRQAEDPIVDLCWNGATKQSRRLTKHLNCDAKRVVGKIGHCLQPISHTLTFGSHQAGDKLRRWQ